MNNRFDVATIGGAVIDITFSTNDGKILDNPERDPACLKLLGFEYGAKIKIDEAEFYFGGGAQNAAVCFSRLGLRTASFLSLGDDEYGNRSIKNLKGNKVDTKFIQKLKNIPTGFSFILVDKKTSEHVAFAYRGANSNLEIKYEDLKEIEPKWIYITSLSGEWKKKVLDQIFKYKKESNVKIAWNPGSEQLDMGYKGLKKYLNEADVIILNRDEAVELEMSDELGGKQKNNLLVKDLLFNMHNNLKRRQEKVIIAITEGENGAHAYDGKDIFYVPARKVKVADTTGVGDSFGASFVAGLEVYHGDIEKSLKLGIVNAGSVITKAGAENGLLYRKDVQIE